MVPLSSSIVSQFLIAGLVVGAVPYTVAKSVSADEGAHRPIAMAAPSSEDLAAEHRYLELAEASTVEPPAEATVEEAARALAASLAAIPVGDLEGAASCPTEKLTVSWEVPSADHTHGAYVTPLGPAPGPETDEVNGVVLCDGYPYAFMGFEASRDGSTWDVVAVPFLGADEDEHGHEPANDDADEHAHDDHDDHAPAEPTKPAPPAPRIDIPVADLGPIEGYAAYEPQRICHPTAKPGTDALRRLLTGHYTSTRNLGIARGCSVGGRSEHKEGRAFDWGAYAHREVERKSVEDLIGRLLATDEAGNRHALARRMGVMYIIWNERIWSAYRSDAGWRPYGGRSPHTDHVHISLSWDGAMGRTSFWNANGVEALFGTPAGTTVAAAKPVHAAPAPPDDHAEGDDHAKHDDHAEEREATDEATEEARAEREQAREKYERRIREWREARERRQREREERRAAGLPIDEQSEAELAVREAEAATEEAKEALEEAEDDAEKAERRAQREADRANRRAEWQTERERRQQVREERQAEREVEREQRQTQKAAERAERQAAKEAERAERQAQKDAERTERQAQKDAERAERQAAKEAEREQRRQEREQRQAQKEAERAERRAQKEREREERRAQKEAERAERQAQKEREREERRAQKEAERAERRAQKEAERAGRRGGGGGG